MYGLFYTWHGRIALGAVVMSGFAAIYRLRDVLEQWKVALAVAAVILVGGLCRASDLAR